MMATVEIPKPRELRDYEYLERRRSWSEPDWERYTSNAQTSANGKQLVLRTRRSGRSRSQSRSRSPPAYDNDHERRYYRGRSDSSRASRSNERYARNERQVDLIESKHVNGVWYPGQSKDLTVHSSLDIKEDLEPDIGQFYRLYKIGSFTEARSYFDENLAGHFDKPLVFVMYAEMLFRQGSYHEICDLDAHIMTRFTQDAPKQLHGRILKGFWDLINSMSRHLTMRPNDALDQMIDDVACDLENHITDDERKCIGSVEVNLKSSSQLHCADQLTDRHDFLASSNKKRQAICSPISLQLLSRYEWLPIARDIPSIVAARTSMGYVQFAGI